MTSELGHSQPRRIVVTGASGALGRAVVDQFQAEGARLALLGRDETRLREQLESEARDALFLGADVTSEVSVSAAMTRVLHAFEGVDVLVHVAGGFEMGEPTHALSLSSWERMMNLNAWSFVNVTRDIVPVMRAQKSGNIVAVSSRSASAASANMGAYSAAKSALSRLVEALSHEVRGDGINVNSIAPTVLDTPANRRAMPGVDPAGWVSTARAASVIAFLASAEAAALHGQHLAVGV